jgi:hypothetical protein
VTASPDTLVVLAAAAGRAVPLDPDEVRAVVRRALLLHAAGGDALRGFDLDGRAVLAAAADLDRPERRDELARGLAELCDEAGGSADLAAALAVFEAEPDLAWRSFACSVLLEWLEEDENDSPEKAQVSRGADV